MILELYLTHKQSICMASIFIDSHVQLQKIPTLFSFNKISQFFIQILKFHISLHTYYAFFLERLI
jgi:hypothetical protein